MNSTFFHALTGGTIEEVKRLVESNPTCLNAQSDETGQTPVFIAATMNRIDIIEYLAGKDANLETRDNRGLSPMDAAVVNEKIEVIKCLAKYGADINASMFTAVMAGKTDAIECLKELGADLEAKNRDGMTPITMAALAGQVDSIKCLTNLGVKVNAKSENDIAPIFLAVQAGQLDCVKYLISLGANVNATINGMTPLSIAVGEGHSEIAELLRNNGAK